MAFPDLQLLQDIGNQHDQEKSTNENGKGEASGCVETKPILQVDH